MAVTMNALDLIDQQLTQAATPRVSRKPLFLFLKDGHKALIRPLSDLKDAVVLKKHNKWNTDPADRVNAICAKEEDKNCIYCQKAASDKKLNANMCFYLPVYVYAVVDQKTGQKLTFTKKDENGTETSEVVSGMRLLELSAYGAPGKILKSFREFMREEDSPSIIALDFNLTQVGKETNKDFILMPRKEKSMPDEVQAIANDLNIDELRARIIESCPPVIAEEGYHPARGASDAAIDAVVQGVKNAQVADDTIGDF